MFSPLCRLYLHSIGTSNFVECKALSTSVTITVTAHSIFRHLPMIYLMCVFQLLKKTVLIYELKISIFQNFNVRSTLAFKFYNFRSSIFSYIPEFRTKDRASFHDYTLPNILMFCIMLLFHSIITMKPNYLTKCFWKRLKIKF